jgi:hypothetical protein
MDVRVSRELSAPGLEDAGAAGQGGAHNALLLGEPFEGLRGGMAQGLVGEALR